jgi:predicted metal-dependent phosphoesterase TrpH
MNISKSKKLITVEFHCHTSFSRDSHTDITSLVKTARELGLNRLAITDHNTIAGALKAKEMAPDLIIVGEEVHTSRGELIGYFIKEEIPRGLSVQETIHRLREQDAFISIPHPFDVVRHGWHIEELFDLIPEVDALEVFNARCLRAAYNDQALAFAQQHHKLMLAGSDAHALSEIGLTLTYLQDFNNAEELRTAAKTAIVKGSRLSAVDHFKTSLYTGLLKLIGKK